MIISASRTKDPVRVSPDRLAEILTGRAPVRYGLGPTRPDLPLERVGAVVFWTKDPDHLLTHDRLRRAVRRLLDRTGGLIVLNLTVTGLAGTALEPGLPLPGQVRDSAARLIDEELVAPELVILRYDPLIQVKTGAGRVIGNMSIGRFDSVQELFIPLGIKRFKTSLVDASYRHLPARFGRLGLELDLPEPSATIRFIEEMRGSCRRMGTRLDICCHPEDQVTEETAGCIDGRLINRQLELSGASWRVTTRPHNDIGRQRRTCRCTYSRDIGYSAGFQTCFKNHGACIYCYSQNNAAGPAVMKAAERAK